MAEHYTKATVMVTAWCKPCAKMTTHDVYGGRKGGCQECLKRLAEEAKKPKRPAPATQDSLF